MSGIDFLRGTKHQVSRGMSPSFLAPRSPLYAARSPTSNRTLPFLAFDVDIFPDPKSLAACVAEWQIGRGFSNCSFT